MQTTLTATIIDYPISTIQKLDTFNALFNSIKRLLYKDIISYYKKNNVNTLSKQEINRLKSSYQQQFNINSRHYNSLYADLTGNISSVIALNKDYLNDTKENILSLEKKLKSKQKTLNNLLNEMSAKNYISKHIDNVNLHSLKHKVYRIKQNVLKANKKLQRLDSIEKTGNPHLCFGSNKLFRQQFLIDNSKNNLTNFKTHEDWKKAWTQSRNQTFMMIGSKDETLGNTNCQIKHIRNEIYQLTINVDKNATKYQDKFITVNIQLHNDKYNLVLNAINNHINNNYNRQPISYRFYKDYKNDTYKVFISLDKSKQQPAQVSHKLAGCIGIDINHDHLSVTEINHHGNLKSAWDIQLNLKGKSSDQSLDNIACAIKSITDYAVKVSKPIVIEKLDFSSKKKSLKDSCNKKYNKMLSSFAYRKILELIKSRCFDKGIETIEVNPAYTSKIGKFKYQNLYKLTTHQAASFVIARRGFLSYSKLKFKKSVKVDKNTQKEVTKKEYKEVLVVYKEKTISIRSSNHYAFVLPARNSQKQEGVYWKEIEQCNYKVKKHRIDLKRKKRILRKQKAMVGRLKSETILVTDNTEVYRDLNPELLFSPF